MLNDPLPDDPMPLFRRWFDEACAGDAMRNPNALTLATVDTSIEPPQPSARIVLCKALHDDPGFIVMYSNYRSRKGRELTDCPRAAGVFYWDDIGRQVRIEGPVLRSPPHESDAYFATRPLGSRIGAWASDQSEPVRSRDRLAEKVKAAERKFAGDDEVPRPHFWGGYRLWIAAIEVWLEGKDRIHDRARWERSVRMGRNDEHLETGAWTVARLQP